MSKPAAAPGYGCWLRLLTVVLILIVLAALALWLVWPAISISS